MNSTTDFVNKNDSNNQKFSLALVPLKIRRLDLGPTVTSKLCHRFKATIVSNFSKMTVFLLTMVALKLDGMNPHAV